MWETLTAQTASFMTNLGMPGYNCKVFNCFSSRAAPEISFLEYQQRMTTKLNWRNNIVAIILRVDGTLNRQIKKQILRTSILSLLTKTFQYTRNWSNAS